MPLFYHFHHDAPYTPMIYTFHYQRLLLTLFLICDADIIHYAVSKNYVVICLCYAHYVISSRDTLLIFSPCFRFRWHADTTFFTDINIIVTYADYAWPSPLFCLILLRYYAAMPTSPLLSPYRLRLISRIDSEMILPVAVTTACHAIFYRYITYMPCFITRGAEVTAHAVRRAGEWLRAAHVIIIASSISSSPDDIIAHYYYHASFSFCHDAIYADVMRRHAAINAMIPLLRHHRHHRYVAPPLFWLISHTMPCCFAEESAISLFKMIIFFTYYSFFRHVTCSLCAATPVMRWCCLLHYRHTIAAHEMKMPFTPHYFDIPRHA